MKAFVALLVAALAPLAAQDTTKAGAVTMRFDYGGAIALISALEQPALADADVARLLRVPGVRGMVDNITRFVPSVGVIQFPDNVKAFARKKRRTREDGAFQFSEVWRTRDATRAMIRELRARERDIIGQAIAQVNRYRPDTGPLAVTVHFVAGGVSDGFVFDDRADTAFYINLARSDGDMDGLASNIAHETYHVLQKAAQRRVPGLAVFADSSERQAAPLRLLTVTLAEGVANYVVDPTKSEATGKQIQQSRDRYRKNAEPPRIRENFALFDRVLGDLRAQRLPWEDAYDQGFSTSGGGDARFYFVGYEMAKVIEHYCGAKCIARLFEQPPIEFFRQYIALYKQHPEIPGRFAAGTEAFLR